MKTTNALLLLSLPMAASLPAGETPHDGSRAAQIQPAHQLTAGDILAAQVAEIAATKDLSDRSKKRQIAAAVRLAVITTTTNLKTPGEALRQLLDLARAAAKAAPGFADTISGAALAAVPQVPLLADAGGLKDRVQDAVFSGVKAAALETGEANFESNPAKSPPPPPADFGGRTDDVIVSPSH